MTSARQTVDGSTMSSKGLSERITGPSIRYSLIGRNVTRFACSQPWLEERGRYDRTLSRTWQAMFCGYGPPPPIAGRVTVCAAWIEAARDDDDGR